MREKLLVLIEDETGFKGATDETTFEQIGMDSLDFILLLNEIRDYIGPVSNKDALGCINIGDLLKVIQG